MSKKTSEKPKAATKKPAAPPKKPDLKIETIQREVRYTDAQIAELMKTANTARKELTALEAQLDNIKEDYKAKTSTQELKRDDAMNKADRGFEMRPCECVVEFNSPKNGRKKYFVHDPANKKDGKGEFVREEDMSAADMQTDFIADRKPSTEQQPGLGLPVEEKKPASGSGDFSEPPIDEPLMIKVLAAIKEKGICNTAFVQRNFKLGHGPATRLLDALEKLGHIGPEGSDKQRPILGADGKEVEKSKVSSGAIENEIKNPVLPPPTAAQVKAALKAEPKGDE